MGTWSLLDFGLGLGVLPMGRHPLRFRYAIPMMCGDGLSDIHGHGRGNGTGSGTRRAHIMKGGRQGEWGDGDRIPPQGGHRGHKQTIYYDGDVIL